MGHKYEIGAAYRDAIAGIYRTVTSSARLVALGQRYNVAKWVEGHAQFLLTRDPSTFPTTDLEVISPDILKVILRVFKEKVHHRMDMVCKVPPLRHAVGCRYRLSCGYRSWPALWNDAARLFIHRTKGEWVSGREIFEKLLAVVDAIGSVGAPTSDLHKACGQSTLDLLKEHNVLWKDEDRQAQAVTEIIKLCNVTTFTSFDPFDSTME